MSAPTELVTYYLELREAPRKPRPSSPRAGVEIRQVTAISPAFYGYLYDLVGRSWQWVDRKQLDDGALQLIIGDPLVEVYVLSVAGEPAAYLELDARIAGELELAYFGVAPAFIGQGLGSYFLQWGVAHAFKRPIARLWVHTCNLDHPRALAVYRQAGFTLYDTVKGPLPAS